MDVLFLILKCLSMLTNAVWIDVIGGSYKVLKLGRSKNGYKKCTQLYCRIDYNFRRQYL